MKLNRKINTPRSFAPIIIIQPDIPLIGNIIFLMMMVMFRLRISGFLPQRFIGSVPQVGIPTILQVGLQVQALAARAVPVFQLVMT